MKPRRLARSLNLAEQPEPQMRKFREVGVDVFACPVCRQTVGARYLF